MQKRIALLLFAWTAALMLASCADERHVVKTPVPPPPPRTNVVAQ